MAAGLLSARMMARGCRVEVASAGLLEPGIPPPAEVVEAMAERGVAVSGHRSRQVGSPLVEGADLVVTMTRQQLIEVITLAPDSWWRCFTLVDLVRRAEAIGAPSAGEEARTWVRRLGGARQRAGLLRLDAGDDIEDPMGGPRAGYDRVARQIDALVDSLAARLCAAQSVERA